jgi:hypothetical protein
MPREEQRHKKHSYSTQQTGKQILLVFINSRLRTEKSISPQAPSAYKATLNCVTPIIFSLWPLKAVLDGFEGISAMMSPHRGFIACRVYALHHPPKFGRIQ